MQGMCQPLSERKQLTADVMARFQTCLHGQSLLVQAVELLDPSAGESPVFCIAQPACGSLSQLIAELSEDAIALHVSSNGGHAARNWRMLISNAWMNNIIGQHSWTAVDAASSVAGCRHMGDAGVTFSCIE